MRVRTALVEMAEARDIHQRWVDHFDACPYDHSRIVCECDKLKEQVGDAEWHRKWLARYDAWMSLLRASFTTSPDLGRERG